MVEHQTKSFKQILLAIPSMLLGAFLAAYALEIFLLPHKIIDGGVVGVSILLSEAFGQASLIYPFVLVLSIPFVAIAFKHIGRSMVFQMIFSVASFVVFGYVISEYPWFQEYQGDLLEIVVIGGVCLGLGLGLIIRSGGCLDGTEILGILLSKKYGFTVGSIILAINAFIFTVAGFVYGDWHPPIQSLITFLVVIKVMDMVIVGLNQMKSVMVFSSCPDEIAEALMHELGLGLTILDAKGGFSKKEQNVLFLIAERLQLSAIKSIVHSRDPSALVAVDTLHEVVTLQNTRNITKKL